jgi:hypothetical protein
MASIGHFSDRMFTRQLAYACGSIVPIAHLSRKVFGTMIDLNNVGRNRAQGTSMPISRRRPPERCIR